ncbi:hypothetical protein NC653_016589 [Populus alba x Populus x berolinensis]|uniref:Uncharacterized protein n=1 Tax=Populus alba x Populus x berolinensis TaxID=444605 RepID=A0AAD6QN93_9ROSI|nr:hypothetical protein NC653_016583 [Populus alba x Populus x berolinensis]KAJ6993499.1 hypothetical protein NC653_016589 [Populus alba x Populus x berolinensis]
MKQKHNPSSGSLSLLPIHGRSFQPPGLVANSILPYLRLSLYLLFAIRIAPSPFSETGVYARYPSNESIL